MLVNNDSGLRRAASVGLALSWTAVAVTVVVGVLTLIGGFDASVGQTAVLVRPSDAYSPTYAVQIGSISYFVLAYALRHLIGFLRRSRAGQVFAAETTVHLRTFGRWLVVSAVAAIVLPPLSILLHELFLAPPRVGPMPIIRVPLFTGVFVVTVATLVMLICRVIDEGRRLREELDEIV